MKKFELDPNNRIVYYQNSDQIEAIRQRIKKRIESEMLAEAGDLRKANDELHAQEMKFKDEVWKYIVQADKDQSRVRVKTQVGRGATIIHDYIGVVSKIHTSGLFNMKADGRENEFSIGLSCLLSFEII